VRRKKGKRSEKCWRTVLGQDRKGRKRNCVRGSFGMAGKVKRREVI